MTRHGKRRLGGDAAGAIERQAEGRTKRRRRNPCGPENGLCGDPLASDSDAVGVDGRHGSAGPDLHAKLLERPACRHPQRLRKCREQIRSAFEQQDAGGRRLNAPEIIPQRLSRDLGQRARQFDAGRASSDDHKCQKATLFDSVRLALGGLERQKHAPPHLERVIEGLESWSATGPFRMPEVRVSRAGRNDQEVVRHGIAIGLDDAPHRID